MQYEIAVVHGDGVGFEVCQAAIDVLDAAMGNERFLNYREFPAGAAHFQATGEAVPAATKEGCRRAHAILHGSAGLPGVVNRDGTEAGIDFGLGLRIDLDLYANIRPIKLHPGVVSRLRDRKAGEINYTIIRENSEGLYSSRGAGAALRDEAVIDMLVISRKGVERVCRAAFELARKSEGAPADGKLRVTCCDKANVLRSFAYFRRIFDEVGAEYPDIEKDYSLIDAMTVHLLERPDHYNVIVTENLFGDIISDLGAATVGGMGMSPTAEVGDRHGFFQAAHGSAPTIAGMNIANPFGTIISGAMMLRWLSEKHGEQHLLEIASRIETAVSLVLASGAKTRDLGGTATTRAATGAVIEALHSKSAAT
jgi:3-isopropylmalate dehydrogenase